MINDINDELILAARLCGRVSARNLFLGRWDLCF